MGFVPPRFIPPPERYKAMGYQPTRRPTSIDPPGLFDALLEKITAGELSARDAAVYYISVTVCPTIRPTGEGDLIVMQRREYLLALAHADEPIDPNKAYLACRATILALPSYTSYRDREIEPYTPQAEYDEMLFADPEWQARKEEPTHG